MKRIFCMITALAVVLGFAGCGSAAPSSGPAQIQEETDGSSAASSSTASTSAQLPNDTESLIPWGNPKELIATRENVDAEMAVALTECDGEAEIEYLPDESEERCYVYRMRNPHSQDIRIKIWVYEAKDLDGNLSLRLSSGELTMPTGSPGGWHGSELYILVRLFCADTKAETEMVMAEMDREWQALLDGDAGFFEQYASPLVYRGCQIEEYRPSDDPRDKDENEGSLNLTQSGSPAACAQWDSLLADGTRLPAPTVQELDVDQLGYDYLLLNRQNIAYPSLIAGTATVNGSNYSGFDCEVADLPGREFEILSVSPDMGPEVKDGDVVRFVGLFSGAEAYAFRGRDGMVYYYYTVTLFCESYEVL